MNEEARAAILAALTHSHDYRHHLARILRQQAIDMPECVTSITIRYTSDDVVILDVIEHNGPVVLDDRTVHIASYDAHDRKSELFDWMDDDISLLAEALSMTEYEVMRAAAEHFDLRPGEIPDFWMCREWVYTCPDLMEDIYHVHTEEIERYRLDYYDLAEFLLDQVIRDLEKGGENA